MAENYAKKYSSTGDCRPEFKGLEAKIWDILFVKNN